MNFKTEQLPAGLYFVATPIGNARDITLRALDILASADVIAAEDTRSAQRLMEIHAVGLNRRPLLAYHDHSKERMREKITALIAQGKSCAYVSEAGTPLISDPGFALGNAVIAQGFAVSSAPGPAAVIAALTVAGLPTDRFMFVGFAPTKSAQRRKLFQEVADIQATLVYYESPKRVHESLCDLCDTFGEERQVVLCRELTKRFEDVIRAPAGELRDRVALSPVRGECVILVDRADAPRASDDDIQEALKTALGTMRVKDAATVVAGRFGLARRDVYALALRVSEGHRKG